MQVFLNQTAHNTKAARLIDLLEEISPSPPFAIAHNGAFIPKGSYMSTLIDEGDHIEIIAPITGG